MREKFIFMTFLILSSLTTIAFSETVTTSVGPFNVSFNETYPSFNITAEKAECCGFVPYAYIGPIIRFPADISTDNSSGWINIYVHTVSYNAENYSTMERTLNLLGNTGIEPYIIDGKQGAIGVSQINPSYRMALYWPNSSISCILYLTTQDDRIIKHLLDNMHIEVPKDLTPIKISATMCGSCMG